MNDQGRLGMRLAVLDSSGAALAIARAARELSATRQSPLRIIAVCDPARRNSLFGRSCDEVIEVQGLGRSLDAAALAALLEEAHVDSVWLGRFEPLYGDVLARLERDGLLTVVRWCLDEDTGPASGTCVQVARDHAGEVRIIGCSSPVALGDAGLVAVESPPRSPLGDDAHEAVVAYATTIEGPYASALQIDEASGTGAPVVRAAGYDDIEHLVAELTTGVDTAKLALRLADGEMIGDDEAVARGHALEVVLHAAPSGIAGGIVDQLRMPGGPGIRVDAAVAEGDRIDASTGPVIARICAYGQDRTEASVRLHKALTETVAVVRDALTDQGALIEGLERALGIERATRAASHGATLALALTAAAIEIAHDESAVDQVRFYGWARRGRPRADTTLGHTVELRHGTSSYTLHVAQLGPGTWRVEVDGTRIEVVMERLGRFERRLTLSGDNHQVVIWPQGADLVVSIDGIAHSVVRRDVGLVRTPAPAVVVAIPVAEGDLVNTGDSVAVIESMKMETVLHAPFTGRVRQVLTGTNVQVDAGTALVHIEPVADTTGDTAASHVVFDGLDITGGTAPDDLARWLFMGYDVPDEDVATIVARHDVMIGDGEAARRRVLAELCELLSIYADLHTLTRLRDRREGEAHVRDPNEHLFAFLRSLDADAEGLPDRYVASLVAAVSHYGLDGLERTEALESAMHRIYLSLQRAEPIRSVVTGILDSLARADDVLVDLVAPEMRVVLDSLTAATQVRDPGVADLAHQVRYRYFDQPLLDAARDATLAAVEPHIEALGGELADDERYRHVTALVNCPQHLAHILIARMARLSGAHRHALAEVTTRRYHRRHDFEPFELRTFPDDTAPVESIASSYHERGAHHDVVTLFSPMSAIAPTLGAIARWLSSDNGLGINQIELNVLTTCDAHLSTDEVAEQLGSIMGSLTMSPRCEQIVVSVARDLVDVGDGVTELFTFEANLAAELRENRTIRGMHPMTAERLALWRFSNFELDRLSSAEGVHVYHAVARDNPKDERLFALAEVRDLMPVHDAEGRVVALPELELMLSGAAEGIRRFQASRPPNRRLQWNRILLFVWPPVDLDLDEITTVATRLARSLGGLGIEMTTLQGRLRDPRDGTLHERVLRISSPAGGGVVIEVDDPPTHPLTQLDEYTRKVVQARSRGTVYPYELAQVLAPAVATNGLPRGTFDEYDLDDDGVLVPVERPKGRNVAGVVVGIVRNFTERYPEGMARVAIFGDPTRSLGAISQPECRRIMAALDMAQRLGIPIEWFALSAGAKIAMDSGTENMDGVAAVLRRIIEFTQAGGEVNVIVAGINVGAQPYWNAEATMLMHTKGILVMTPDSAMVLTGKQALEYSGAVSAEDNFGIGGYERIMGPNGQAQYWASDLTAACRLLLTHYEHAYVAPGERFPRRAPTTDPAQRDISDYPHALEGSSFTTVGEIFSPEANPERKKSFDIRTLMRACADADHEVLERWPDMRGASTAVVWDAHLGGWPVTLLGIESHTLERHGHVPADGPHQWSAGTLFPQSSKKIARAINATSGNRPLVVLANLSGFDGSPESMRSLQLEFGAEIGRAIVNFDGPIVFCVVSRFHGGAFVVFSRWLNDNLEAVAVEGSRASVIGGAPAAAVVFSHEVDLRTRADERLVELDERIAASQDGTAESLRAERTALAARIRAEKLGEMAAEFDAVHSVERALEVGSIDSIIDATALRPYLIDAVERGIAKALDRQA